MAKRKVDNLIISDTPEKITGALGIRKRAKLSVCEISMRVEGITIDVGDTNVPMWWTMDTVPKMTDRERIRDIKRRQKLLTELTRYKEQVDKKNVAYIDKIKLESDRYYRERARIAEQMRLVEEEERVRTETELMLHEQELMRIEAERVAELERERLNAEQEREKLAKLEAGERDKRRRIELEEKKRLISERIEAERLSREKVEADRQEAERLREEKKLRNRELRAEKKRVEESVKAEELRLRLIEEERLAEEEKERELKVLRLIEDKKQRLLVEEKERIELLERAAKENEAMRLKAEEHERLLALAEERRIERLRRSHRIKDVEFVPYPENYPASDPSNVLELRSVGLKYRGEYVSTVDYCVRDKSINVVTGYPRERIEDALSIMLRDYPRDCMISGGAFRYGDVEVTAISRREYRRLVKGAFYVMPYDVEDMLEQGGTVGRYFRRIVGKAEPSLVRDVLMRLNILSANKFMRKKLTSCSASELAKLYVLCCLAVDTKLVVMCEPQRCLDAVTRLALVGLIGEWRERNPSRAMLIFTSDKALSETGDCV